MLNPNTIPSLELIKANDSGLQHFQRSKFSVELSYIQELDQVAAAAELSNRIKIAPFLHLYLLGKHQELKESLLADPSLIALAEIKALKILNLLILGEELKLSDFFPLAADKNSVPARSIENLSKQIIKLYSAIFLSTNLNGAFRALNLSVLEEHLNGISLLYAEWVLRYQIASKYQEVWQILSPYAQVEVIASESPVIASKAKQSLEAIRLLAIYKRMQSDIIGAERYSYLYHQEFKPDTEKRAHLISHANKVAYPAAEVLKHWGDILSECDETQAAVMKQAGLENSTCEYFACTDCCTNTFPVMSYTEYIYLRDWLKRNNYPMAELEQRCNEIQADYEAQYGSRLEVLDKNLPENNIRGIENPHNFKYSCPFLENGRCSIYAARPLLCRGFGLSSDNGVSVKSCNYFIKQYQHNASSSGERDVYDLRQVQSLARSSDRHLTKQESGTEKVLSGTIVAWLSAKL